jgi:hypothetical protein
VCDVVEEVKKSSSKWLKTKGPPLLETGDAGSKTAVAEAPVATSLDALLGGDGKAGKG